MYDDEDDVFSVIFSFSDVDCDEVCFISLYSISTFKVINTEKKDKAT